MSSPLIIELPGTYWQKDTDCIVYWKDVEHAVIVDVEATPARTFDEVAATPVMIDRTERTFASSRSG